MPRVNVWIRKEDWSKWESIEDKPTWLSHSINSRGEVLTDNKCNHLNRNKKTRMCLDCGEPL